MNKRKIKSNKGVTLIFLIIVLILILIATRILVDIVYTDNNHRVYFNVPASWDDVYAYITDQNGTELNGVWPGEPMACEQDYIYSVNLTNLPLNAEVVINFNNGNPPEHNFSEGKQYSVTTNYQGNNKIYNLISGIGGYTESPGEWIDYSKNISFGKIPTTKQEIKNVIYMIGDGMGENHIKAGALYKGETLNVQTIPNTSYVKTASINTVTDSAAGATALFAGKKAVNYTVGLDKYGNDTENLMEFSKNSLGMKVGFACTELLCHATPASFSVHNVYRYNYDEIVLDQINSGIDVMLGGGRTNFAPYQSEMIQNNFVWVNNFADLENVNKNQKVIGTFAEGTIGLGLEANRTSLADLTEESLERLENDDGFVLMVEGSDIDVACHNVEMDKMLVEMIDFDDAIGVAMKYVDEHPDTLLVITADHETGGIDMNGVVNKEQLTNDLFKNPGGHTETDVLVYAYGNGAEDLTQYDVIDNTSIFKFIKQGLENCYK